MKYIVLKDERGGEFAVFCLAPQTHAEMATAWRRDTTRRVVAAGFCEFLSTGHAIVFGQSDSLNLGNRGTQDAALISAMYLGTVEMARRSDGSARRGRGFTATDGCLGKDGIIDDLRCEPVSP